MAAAHSFQRFETTGGAQIFRLPVEAFPNFWAYAYLVLTDDMRVLIDTGSGSDQSIASLEEGLRRVNAEAGINLRFTDLTHILITHGHIDHFSGLVYLHDRTSALVGVHELDLQTLTRHEERLALMSRRLEAYLETAGVPSEERGQLIQMYRFTKAFYHSVPVDFTYEAVDMQVGPFEMIHLPGHCPGHVAIRLDDVVFSGDNVLSGITPHQSPEELTPYMGLRHYLESLTILQHWANGSRLILSGHDDPIDDLHARVKDIRDHLAQRIRQVLDALDSPHTIAEITGKIYHGMAGYNELLVLEKVGAYVEHLYQRGLLEITNLEEVDDSGKFAAVRYHRIHDVSDSEILPKEKSYVFV
jgi:glyoxylase-like metal-dependent hydrolase (beta-lactamase superfamily II)